MFSHLSYDAHSWQSWRPFFACCLVLSNNTYAVSERLLAVRMQFKRNFWEIKIYGSPVSDSSWDRDYFCHTIYLNSAKQRSSESIAAKYTIHICLYAGACHLRMYSVSTHLLRFALPARIFLSLIHTRCTTIYSAAFKTSLKSLMNCMECNRFQI